MAGKTQVVARHPVPMRYMPRGSRTWRHGHVAVRVPVVLTHADPGAFELLGEPGRSRRKPRGSLGLVDRGCRYEGGLWCGDRLDYGISRPGPTKPAWAPLDAGGLVEYLTEERLGGFDLPIEETPASARFRGLGCSFMIP